MRNMARTALSIALGLLLWIGVAPDVGAQQYPDHCEPMQQTSGYVDEDGCPISMEDFEVIRAREEGMQWGNIAMLGGGIGFVAVGVVVWRKRRTPGEPTAD